ncbi:MAG: DUF4347 domain-containing protein [Alcanivoracaceae bacterium]|nr:DUF4347 domain-containing protein [Alcanivoracaceae bacterium]
MSARDPVAKSHWASAFALEQRVLLDAAAVETVADQIDADSADVFDQTDIPVVQPATEDTSSTVVVIDTSVDGYEQLLPGLVARADVFFIDSTQDGLSQLAQMLEGLENIDRLEIYSHGQEGQVLLGTSVISLQSVSEAPDSLGFLRDVMSESGDILIYGCNVAETDEGKALINKISEITGADVAASVDLTTGTEYGGDWDLEYQVGDVSAETMISERIQQSFSGVLATNQWVDMATLLNSDSAANDEHGWSVAIADNSGIIAVGGWNQVDVYAYVPTGSGQYDEYKISPPAGATGGSAVDIDGNFMIVGYRAANRIYIYEFTGGSWVERFTTTGAGNFGYDVGIQAEGGLYRAIVGAPTNTSGQGRAYAYYSSTGNGQNWVAGGTLSNLAGDYDSELDFGWSVAIDGNTVVVGAPGYGRDNVGCGYNCSEDKHDIGVAYIYDWNTGNSAIDGTADHTLRPDGANDGPTGARFGEAVDVSVGTRGELVAVGSPQEGAGEAYIFRDGGNIANVFAGDRTNDFGFSVAIDSNTGRLLVGEYDANVPGLDADAADGRVYTYTHSATNTWTQGTTLDSPIANIRYGWSVAIARDLAVVGAPWADINTISNSGLVLPKIFNYAPVANNDVAAIGENQTLSNFNPLTNDTDANGVNIDVPGIVAIVPPSLGTTTLSGNRITFNPGTDFDYLAAGESTNVVISYTILDAGGETSTATLTITVNGQNDAVVVDQGISNQTGNANQLNVIAMPADAFRDPDLSNTLTYSLLNALNNPVLSLVLADNQGTGTTLTVTINAATGAISYTPNDANRGKTYTIPGVRASDGTTTANENGFVISVARANSAPTPVGSIGTVVLMEDATYGQNVSGFFTDPDFAQAAPWNSEALTFSVSGAPAWVTIDQLTGELSARGLNGDVNGSPYTFNVVATDEFGLSVSQSMTIDLRNTNDAPVVTNEVVDQQAFLGGAAYNYQLPANLFTDLDPTADTITLSATFADGRALGTAGPGQWLTFNPATRTFSGTVSGDAIGTVLNIRVIATDNGFDDTDPSATPNPLSTEYYFEISIFPNPSSGSSVATGGGNNELGASVAISEDGLWLVVGEPRFGGGDNYTGRITVYNWNGTAWANPASFQGAGLAAFDRFGYSVAIDNDGSRIAVGAPGDDTGQGRVYLFERAGALPSNFAAAAVANIVSPDRAAQDGFGWALDFNQDGSLLLVGEPGDDTAGSNAGAAFLFNWGATAPGAGQVLRASADAGEASVWQDNFGWSVSLDRNVAVIGAPYDSSNGNFFNGSATVVGVTSGTFNADRVKGTGEASYDLYGWDVSIDVFRGVGTANVNSSLAIAVGAPGYDSTRGLDAGAVYTYRSNAMGTAVTATHLASIALIERVTAYDGQEYDRFGWSVSVEAGGLADLEATTGANGLRLAAGSSLNGADPGSVYAYKYWSNTGVWLGQKYYAASQEGGSQFGYAADISGQRLVMGAPQRDGGGAGPTGEIFTGTTVGSPIETQPLSSVADKTLDNGSLPEFSNVNPGMPLFLQHQDDDELGKDGGNAPSLLLSLLSSADADPETQAESSADVIDITGLIMDPSLLIALEADVVTGNGDASTEQPKVDADNKQSSEKNGSDTFSEQLKQSRLDPGVFADELLEKLADLVA